MTKYKIPRSIALDISECVSRALHEDIGDGDITASLILYGFVGSPVMFFCLLYTSDAADE